MRRQFSVIVITRNRPDTLNTTLTSLLTQRYPKSRYEVLVVENGVHTADTKKLILKLQKTHPQLRYISLDSPGISLSRNEGVRSARFSTIVMVDDDVAVSPDFLSGYERAWQRYPKASILGSRVVPKIIGNPQLTPTEQRLLDGQHWCLTALDLGDQDQLLPLGRMLYTANMSFQRAEQLDKNGHVFSPALGVPLYLNFHLGAEDFEFCARNILKKRQIVYCADPDLTVLHSISRDRFTQKYLRQRYFLAGIEMYLVDQVLKKQFPKLGSFYLKRFRNITFWFRLLWDWNEWLTLVNFLFAGKYYLPKPIEK